MPISLHQSSPLFVSSGSDTPKNTVLSLFLPILHPPSDFAHSPRTHTLTALFALTALGPRSYAWQMGGGGYGMQGGGMMGGGGGGMMMGGGMGMQQGGMMGGGMIMGMNQQPMMDAVQVRLSVS